VQNLLNNLRQSEVLLAMGVVSLIVLFFVPLPAAALDFLVALNITLGLVILLTILFIKKALEFTAFPMLLLITTTFRLALNVASTRLILSEGHNGSAAAGKIIETFGQVIIGGNFVIGLILFLILIIVNFVVITKGSGRIAEVAARFTLDSLPGKQMAIDADLNAGLINEDDARTRRKELEQETGFFGAMDGASKFVRGDAIAGLIITALNIAVGIIVGMAQHGMTIGDAANRYTVLTVGDGLVAYIPALTISIGAGMLVAKSGTSTAAGDVVFGQIFQDTKALYMVAVLMVFISLMPNMPKLPFWAIAAGLVYASIVIKRKKDEAPLEAARMEAEAAAEEAATAPPEEEPMASVLHVDTLKLELGYNLLNLIDESRGGRLTDQIKAMRRQMAKDIGFVVPSIRIQDNMQAGAGQYLISIKDIKAGEGVLEPGQLLAMDPTGSAAPINGTETIEPTFGLPARWINEAQKEEAAFSGYTVVDNATVIVTHLTEVIKDNLSDLLTRNEVEKLLDENRGEHGKLIDEIVPERVSIGLLQQVLKNLLRERVSIRDLPGILEALGDAPNTRNIASMTEHVRQRLSRQISMQHANPADKTLNIIALTPAWEKEFTDNILTDGEERHLAMAPEKVQSFVKVLKENFERQLMNGINAALITSPTVRPFARMLVERSMPSVPVISQVEIHPKARIKTVGTI